MYMVLQQTIKMTIEDDITYGITQDGRVYRRMVQGGNTSGLDNIGYPLRDIAVRGNIVFVLKSRREAGPRGLWIIEYDEWSGLEPHSFYYSLGIAYRVVQAGDYIYMVNGFFDNDQEDWFGIYAGLRIVDATNPEQPVFAGSYLEGVGYGNCKQFEDVVIHEDYAFILINGYTHIVDVSRPGRSELIAEFGHEGGDGYRIAFEENLLFIATSDGLSIVDVSDFDNPEQVCLYETERRCRCVAPDGDLAYIGTGGWEVRGEFRILDISDVDNPQELGSLDLRVIDLVIDGNYAFVLQLYTNHDLQIIDNLNIVDISDPENPNIVCILDTPGIARSIYVSDGFAFIADGSEGGLRVIDVSDPEHPRETGFYDTRGNANSVTVIDHYAYVADGYHLCVYDCSHAMGINEPSSFTDVPDSPLEVRECEEIEFTVTAIDPDGDVMTLSMESDNLPEEAEYVDQHDGSGRFHWQTGFYDSGVYDPLFIASDGDMSDSIRIEIRVIDRNCLPTAFNLLLPPNNEHLPDQDSVNFVWQSSLDTVEDSVVTYALAFGPQDRNETNWYRDLLDTSFAVPLSAFHYLNETDYEWWVWSYDRIDSVMCDSVFIFKALLGIDEYPDELPIELTICSAYPNPFNSTVTLTYTVPALCNVDLSVFDYNGRKVARLASGMHSPGVYEVAFNGRGLPNGINLTRLESGDKACMTKLLCIK